MKKLESLTLEKFSPYAMNKTEELLSVSGGKIRMSSSSGGGWDDADLSNANGDVIATTASELPPAQSGTGNKWDNTAWH